MTLRSALPVPAVTILWALLGLPIPAAGQTLYNRPHEALIEAIRSGGAQGVLIGNLADQLHARLEGRSPIQLSVRVLRPLSQAGCARLEMLLTKDQVPTPKGLTQARIRSELSYCLDGRPPGDPR